MAINENQYFNQLASLLKGFFYMGDYYKLFAHPYNATWTNERSVEIPVFRNLLESARGPVLEIGNVLSHYQKVDHQIVDLFEVGPGVLNIDVLDYKPENKYDLILAISTIEHIGRDDGSDRLEKAAHAVEHLKTLLAPRGRLIVSVPMGYNPYVDGLLPRVFDLVYYLERVDYDSWRQLPRALLKNTSYDKNTGANAVAFGYFTQKERII